MPIDVNSAAQYYAQGTAANVNKWVSKATEKAGEWEQKAKSPEAEQNYAEGVSRAVQHQLRLKGLQSVSAQEWAGAVQGSGSVYQQKTSMAVNKWASRFAPYAAIIDRVVSTLPPKTPGNGVQNWLNRGAPIVEALQSAKLQGVMTSRPAPMTRTPTTPAGGFGSPFMR